MVATEQNNSVQVIHATPELWGSILSCPTAPIGMEGVKMVLVMMPGWGKSQMPGSPAAARYVFRQAGCMCEVVFNGGLGFYIRNTDGAKYLDYLLHHPNKPIRAFDLEILVNPKKGGVREANSIQKSVDAQTKSESRDDLLVLEDELEESVALELADKSNRLRVEIGKLKAIIGNNSLLDGDTGERARDNVRKAITKVINRLRRGNKEEQAFGQHVFHFVSLGYDVAYNQQGGNIWN